MESKRYTSKYCHFSLRCNIRNTMRNCSQVIQSENESRVFWSYSLVSVELTQYYWLLTQWNQLRLFEIVWTAAMNREIYTRRKWTPRSWSHNDFAKCCYWPNCQTIEMNRYNFVYPRVLFVHPQYDHFLYDYFYTWIYSCRHNINLWKSPIVHL